MQCSGGSADVVLYCSQDQEYAEGLVKQFEQKTGLKVRAQYDVELTKSIGLTNQIELEKDNPRCDVFWNNEPINTIFLKNAGLLAPYNSPNAADIPPTFKDPDGYWSGFAARGRIIIANDKLAGEGPKPSRLMDLIDPKQKGRCVLAKPLAGTTVTHMLVLFEVLGDQPTRNFLEKLVSDGVDTAAGNAHVMRQVREGVHAWGFTDTDDYHGAKVDGFAVSSIYPDQGADETGTLVLPNTVAMVRGGPHPENAKKLIDYLLSPEVEQKLAAGRSAQIPLHPTVPHPEHVKVPGIDFKPMTVDFAKVAEKYNERMEYLKKLFLQ
jgi:iron(III) transport system substrate-binding protein